MTIFLKSRYWRFFKSVLKHKWFVLVAGRRLKVPLWRLLVHDLSKFTFAEFGPYARHFYGGEIDPRDFTIAWHFHKLRNNHHWENWVSIERNQVAFPMPLVCVREMIADWFAASRTYDGTWPDPKNYTWFKKNRPKMYLCLLTEKRIDLVLAEATQWEWK